MAKPASSAWSPISSGLVLWSDTGDEYDADFTYSSGVVVSQANDRSGAGNHLAQATAANQPNRNGTQNSRTTVVFDGSNHSLATSGSVNLGTAHTWIIACPPSSGSQDYLLYQTVAGGQQHAIISKYNNGGVKSYEWYASAGGRCTIGSGSETGWHVLTVRRNGTAIDTRIDGAASNTATLSVNSTANNPIILGASNLADNAAFSYGTLLIYNTNLSDADCATNEAGLKTRWGIS